MITAGYFVTIILYYNPVTNIKIITALIGGHILIYNIQ